VIDFIFDILKSVPITGFGCRRFFDGDRVGDSPSPEVFLCFSNFKIDDNRRYIICAVVTGVVDVAVPLLLAGQNI
jgi:hypothetical protein